MLRFPTAFEALSQTLISLDSVPENINDAEQATILGLQQVGQGILKDWVSPRAGRKPAEAGRLHTKKK